MRRVIVALLVVGVMLCVGCSSHRDSVEAKERERLVAAARISGLSSEQDSLAYIVGMNVANMLQKMDSTINLNVVCRAILEHGAGDAIMGESEAKESYLRYLLFVEPERRRGYEEQFLADLAKSDRNFTRTKSGLTYNIGVIGDEKLTPKGDNDWVTISYNISRVGGEQIYPTTKGEFATESFDTSEMMAGVRESIGLIGKGGEIIAWIPSRLAYGEQGDEEHGVKPIETLLYKIKLVDVERNKAQEKRAKNINF